MVAPTPRYQAQYLKTHAILTLADVLSTDVQEQSSRWQHTLKVS